MPGRTPIERLSSATADEFLRRKDSMVTFLTENGPPFQVKMSDQDAYRRYRQWVEDGYLYKGRVSNGGEVPDDDMDRLAAWGARKDAEYMPQQVLAGTIEPGTQPYQLFEQLRRQWVTDAESGEQPEVLELDY